MPLQSMTGFSRNQGEHETGSWVWELRSVNNKGLDLRLRLPYGMEALELPCKKKLSAAFSRGSIQASLQFDRAGQAAVPTVNEEALEAVLQAAEQLRKRLDAPAPTVEGLLSIKGVLEMQDIALDEDQLASRDKAIAAGLDSAIQGLEEARISEGSAIVDVLKNQVARIASLVEQIIDDPSRSPQAISARLQEQLAPLLEQSSSIDPQRLHQEAAILATKADLQEELDRLQAHVTAANQLLAGEGPAGRKLDFLAQEFNRECNTICSKSNAASVTAIGLDLKIIVDQFREQIQNLE